MAAHSRFSAVHACSRVWSERTAVDGSLTPARRRLDEITAEAAVGEWVGVAVIDMRQLRSGSLELPTVLRRPYRSTCHR